MENKTEEHLDIEKMFYEITRMGGAITKISATSSEREYGKLNDVTINASLPWIKDDDSRLPIIRGYDKTFTGALRKVYLMIDRLNKAKMSF